MTTKLFTTDSGLETASEKERASRFGRTEQSTKATGRMTRPTDMDDSFTLMATFTTVSGSTTKLMAEVHTSISTEQNTPENGKKTLNMALGWKSGLTNQSTKEATSLVRNTELVSSDGQTARCTSVNFTATTSTEKEFTLGPMVGDTKESGEPTKCTVKAPLPGWTVASSWDSTSKTERRATESLSGQTNADTEASGTTENSTVREPSPVKMAKKNTASGKTVNVFTG